MTAHDAITYFTHGHIHSLIRGKLFWRSDLMMNFPRVIRPSVLFIILLYLPEFIGQLSDITSSRSIQYQETRKRAQNQRFRRQVHQKYFSF